MSHFSALKDSSPEANEFHTLIFNHPAFPYLRTGKIYDALYLQFKGTTDNLSEARLRTVLHVLHILDTAAASLAVTGTETKVTLIPEHLFYAAFGNPKYKAYSPMVTAESRKRQVQRVRKSLSSATSEILRGVDTNNVMFNFVKGNK